MSRTGSYLRIPESYARHLGGLRWCPSGEAVEYVEELPSVGLVFALSGEIGRFLDGFLIKRDPIHFGQVLHLLHLLGLGRGGTPAWSRDLAMAFYENGRPLGNAGAFCAVLTGPVPAVPLPPDRRELSRLLASDTSMAALASRWAAEPWALTAAEPSVAPESFESAVRAAVEGYSFEEMKAWFRHGRGPIREVGEALGRAVAEGRPRSLSGVLTPLLGRPRLAPAAPLVASVLGALALPPRRLAHRELPLGGYTDVTNKGNPEQILPSQFALDEPEFLRRFAERELLYYHREEPHAPRTEELVVVLDQGVRTWGDVRLILTAAVIALARRAERLGIRFRIVSTDPDGAVLDPLEVDRDALGERLEASDLSANPAAALARALADRPESAPSRDVVLLTHPRSLDEREVSAAARSVPAGTRLYALGVDGRGASQFAELRGGAAIALSRFQVRVSAATPVPAAPASPPTDAPAEWRGDLEPIPFPFRLGLTSRVGAGLFALDHEGRWLLAATHLGMLHLIRADGSGHEMLPRGMLDGSVLREVEVVLGLAGGFLVAGQVEGRRVAFHYDVEARACRAFDLGANLGHATRDRWFYLRSLHAVVLRWPEASPRDRAIELATGRVSARPDRVTAELKTSVIARAFAEADGLTLPPPYLQLDGRPSEPSIEVDPRSGRVALRAAGQPWEPFTPIADGRPALAGAKLLEAQLAGNALAVSAREATAGRGQSARATLRLFRGPHGDPMGEYPLAPGCEEFALSGDGRILARRIGWRIFQVREALNAADRGIVTSKGRHHDKLQVELGDVWLIARAGRRVHLIRWDRERLEIRSSDGQEPSPFLAAFGGETLPFNYAVTTRRPGAVAYDHRRFLTGCPHRLDVAVDVLGQVAILEPSGALVCMFFVFRHAVAAWLPDGTRLGPSGLIGGAETPDAAARVARALRDASGRSVGVSR